jgi:hypothetical protein
MGTMIELSDEWSCELRQKKPGFGDLGAKAPGRSPLRDERYWLDRAEEAHVIASEMTNDAARRLLLELAQEYEERAARAKSPSPLPLRIKPSG